MKQNETGLPRRGFARMLAALVGAATLPQAVRAAFPGARRRDVITQKEIQATLDLDIKATREVAKRLLAFRRRLEAGAAVEIGPLSAEIEPMSYYHGERADDFESQVQVDCWSIEECGTRIGNHESSWEAIFAEHVDRERIEEYSARGYRFPQRVQLA